jgi:excinuclease ABC subunit B
MQRAMDVTNTRRDKQIAYNKEHGITPKTIRKKLTTNLLDMVSWLDASENDYKKQIEEEAKAVPKDQLNGLVDELQLQMQQAAKMLDFEKAAKLRDQLQALKALTH